MTLPVVQSRAFSLVEVVISLAVISFALLTLLGLFGVGMASGRKSGEDTSLASISWQVLTDLQSQTNFKAAAIASSASTNYIFDYTGQPTNAETRPYFACQVTARNPSASEVTATGQSLDSGLVMATLTITWPSNVHPAPNTNYVYATLAP